MAALLVAISMTAGCGSSTPPPVSAPQADTSTPAPTSAPAATDNTTAATAAPDTAAATDNTAAAPVSTDPLQPDYDASMYPTPLSVDVFSAGGTYQGALTSGWFSKILQDKFNMTFNIIGNQAESGNVLFTTRSAAGNLGDLVALGFQDMSDSIKAGNLIMDMTDLYNTRLTAYSAQFSASEKNLQKYLNNSLGIDMNTVYALPKTVSSQPPTNPNTDGTAPQFGSYMRLDYYQGIGSPAINNYNDLLNALQQMQQKYPTSDSGKPTYAFSLFADWDGGGMWWPAQMPYQYGMTRFNGGGGMGFYDPTTGKIQSILDDNGIYKQTLQMLFQANQMGLLDPDSQTQDFGSLTGNKYADGAVLYSPVSWMGIPTFNTDANISAGKGYAFIPIGGTKNYNDGVSPFGDGAVAIGQGAKDPQRLADFLNWMSSPTGFMTAYDGPQGLAWDLDSNGQPYLTDLGVPALQGGLGGSPGPDVPAQYGGGQFTTGSPIGDPGIGFSLIMTWRGTEMNPLLNCPYDSRLWTSTLTNNATALDKSWQAQFGASSPIDYLTKNSQLVVSSPSNYVVPPFTTDQNTTMQSVSQELVNDSWQMVWAADQASFDSQWQTMVTNCQGLGSDDILALDQQEASDLYAAQQQYISDYNASK